MPSGGAWTCTFPATRHCYDKQLASQTGTWSILGMIAWFIQSKIQFQKVHDFWCMRKLMANHFKMVANHLEFHGWYGSFTSFHPSLSRNLFQLLAAKDAREVSPSPAPSKTDFLMGPRLFPGSFWVVASMSSTSLHHPTNNQSSWSCCNKVSGMPLTNSTSFSWIPEWLAASNQYTPENKRLEITNSGVRNVSFRGCRVFWEICKRKKPDIYSNLHGRSWILIWKLLYLMAIWYKVGIHIHG